MTMSANPVGSVAPPPPTSDERRFFPRSAAVSSAATLDFAPPRPALSFSPRSLRARSASRLLHSLIARWVDQGWIHGGGAVAQNTSSETGYLPHAVFAVTD